MKFIKLKAFLGAIVLGGLLVTTGCTSKNDDNLASDVLEDNYYKYDNSNLDLYQVVVVNNNGNIEPILVKLYATPVNPVVSYKVIGDIKVVYEFNRDTNEMTSYFDILEIRALSSYLSNEDAELLDTCSDDEAINLYYKNVINTNGKKLTKNY